MTARSTVAVLLAVALGLLAAAPATAAGPDEAVRQLRFARAELAAGSWDRALQSADSALTLDPALAEARVLKALAYEGLGELAIAQALLLAHREALGGSLADGSEAAAALARIDERLARGDAGGGETALALLPSSATGWRRRWGRGGAPAPRAPRPSSCGPIPSSPTAGAYGATRSAAATEIARPCSPTAATSSRGATTRPSTA